MTTRRDRRRFERAVARAIRPSRRSWLTSPILRRAGIAVAVVVAGLVVSLPWITSRKIDDLQGGGPVAATPTREASERRPAETREAHLRQLQPILRADADRLAEIARRARAEGRATDLNRDRSDEVQRALSEDLQNHYPEYSQAKERLRRTVAEQDEELNRAVQLMMARAPVPPGAEHRRQELARVLVAKCFDKSPGTTLSATATEDEREAFEAFTSLQMDSDVAAHCQSLKKRATGIAASARKLSTDARALAERPTLPGECRYTRPEQASGG